MTNEGEKKEEEKKGEKEEKVVTLSESQYSALLDRVAELEDVSLSKKKDIYDIDELAEEGKRREVIPVKGEEVDWEALSNKELVDKIVEAVNQGGLQLQTQIETQKVLREIDKCEVKYDDFWKFEKDIRRIATENPTLSIEKAYRLAKLEIEGDKKEEKKEGEKREEVGAKTTRTEKLLNLPPRVPGGEKPGVVSSSTKGSQTKTLREAADRAWDEAVGKGKESI